LRFAQLDAFRRVWQDRGWRSHPSETPQAAKARFARKACAYAQFLNKQTTENHAEHDFHKIFEDF
jgi:hypothetical protein